MTRIPQEELERLKSEVSVQQLAEARGIKLKGQGDNLLGLCPFHDDKSPSLSVNPAKNVWKCHGACNKGGSVIDWVMEAEGVSFRHAVEILREDPSLVSQAGVVTPVKKSSVQRLPGPFEATRDDAALLSHLMDYYHDRLKQSPHAQTYLTQRGLGSSEMLEAFRIGFADRSLGYRLPAKSRQAGADIRGRLRQLGILRDSGHEHFRGAVVFPIFDEAGHVAEVYGRRIGPSQRGSLQHLYLPGPHRGVFNRVAFKSSREMILCESVIDALTLWCSGFRNVTCAYGVNGLTDELVQAFGEQGVERVLIAYDRDEAGDKGAVAAAAKLCPLGIECYRVQFPQGMDANDVAVEAGDEAAKRLREAISKAVLLGQSQQQQRPDSAPAATATAAQQQPAATSTARSETAPSAEVNADLAAATEPSSSFAAPEPSAAAMTTAAAPLPSSPVADVMAEVSDEEVVIRLGDRRWRVRGWTKNLSFDQLKVNLLVSRSEAFHVDNFDLYSARHRQLFQKAAGKELELDQAIIKRDLGRVLIKLEELHEAHVKQTLEPKDKVPEMTDERRREALALLRDPNLLERILTDFERCGVVGEESNKLVAYLAAVSRKLDKPLAVVIQSSSAAGKSSLMESVLALMPEEDRVKYSAMTGQSLFYMGEANLKHKILAIVEEEGAERAAYALKLLQSEGELTIASTGKDPQTGRLVTHEYRVEGPVMIMLTTTAIEVDEELLNRCLVLAVNEEREQTQAIHRLQREEHMLDGLVARHGRGRVLCLHHNAQRLLRPLWVNNPYAQHLTFADDRTRTRRDQAKYLTLIDSIALLHQHQREVKSIRCDGERFEYIEVTLDDISLANRLASQVMGRSLEDLPPQTRRFLCKLHEMVQQACADQQIEREHYRFTRRQVRELVGCSHEQVRVHLGRLVELEYVLAHRGGRGQSFIYELLYDGRGADGEPFVLGLIDIGALNASTVKSLGGPRANLQASNRGQTGLKQVGFRGVFLAEKGCGDEELLAQNESCSKNAVPGAQKNDAPSYRSDAPCSDGLCSFDAKKKNKEVA